MTDSAEKLLPLLPCPFCGGKKLHICETNFEATNKPSFTVTCLTVDCAGGIFTLGYGRFESSASARSAWNRRAHLSAHPVTGPGDELTLQRAILEATAIGISTIIVRCGPYEKLSPYLKTKYDRLSQLAKLGHPAWPLPAAPTPAASVTDERK